MTHADILYLIDPGEPPCGPVYMLAGMAVVFLGLAIGGMIAGL